MRIVISDIPQNVRQIVLDINEDTKSDTPSKAKVEIIEQPQPSESPEIPPEMQEEF